MMFTKGALVLETTVNAVWQLVFYPKDKLGSASAVTETLVCITEIVSNVTLSTRLKSMLHLTRDEPLLLVLG